MENLTEREKALLNLLIDTYQEGKKDKDIASNIPAIKSEILKESGFSRFAQMMKEIHVFLL